MSQPTPPPPSVPQITTKQDALTSWCRTMNKRLPVWQVMSDRRGGRTAWSCSVTVDGRVYQARFWYDGQYVNNAKEDAAERALQMLGLLPMPPGPQPTHYQQQQQAFYGPSNGSGSTDG